MKFSDALNDAPGLSVMAVGLNVIFSYDSVPELSSTANVGEPHPEVPLDEHVAYQSVQMAPSTEAAGVGRSENGA